MYVCMCVCMYVCVSIILNVVDDWKLLSNIAVAEVNSLESFCFCGPHKNKQLHMNGWYILFEGEKNWKLSPLPNKNSINSLVCVGDDDK
jgi:hypothetical protein